MCGGYDVGERRRWIGRGDTSFLGPLRERPLAARPAYKRAPQRLSLGRDLVLVSKPIDLKL
jgi:hypothetical protein